MAEKFVLGLAQSVLSILGSYAGEKITSAWIAKEELKKLERSLNLICPFIKEADNKLSSITSSTHEEGSEGIKNWLKELKSLIYDIEDLLDEASTDALLLKVMKEGGRKKLDKVRYYISSLKHKLISPFSLSDKVKDLRGRLDQIAADVSNLRLIDSPIDTLVPSSLDHQVDRITYPLPFFNKKTDIKGRDEVKRHIMEMVLGNGVENNRGLSVLAIVGTGGLGKTTLAQMLYSDPEIDNNFDIKLWGCVSKPFHLESVIRRILESVNIVGSGGLGHMVDMLASKVRDKKYFLVLDDVWTRNADEWKRLTDVFAYGGVEGSVTLVTTRDARIATRTIGTRQILNLELLSFNVCMSIFIENAFREGESERYPGLIEVGNIIVEKCGGLPLAVQAMGSMLRGSRDEEEWLRIAHNDLWKEEGILAALRLSYNDLPSYLKLCFAYLSVFPKGVELEIPNVVCLLAAQGLIACDDNVRGEKWEDTGVRYMKELVSRSLLQGPTVDANGKLLRYRMHDLAHDLAMDVMGDELTHGSCNNGHKKVSRCVRHISWGYEDLSHTEKIPSEILPQAQQVRTLRFRYVMPINNMFIEHAISSFKCLRSLELPVKDMEELPDSIRMLKHLRYLMLWSDGRFKALPNSICKLVNLRTLILAGCHRSGNLPEDIGKLINLNNLVIAGSNQCKYVFPKRMTVIRPSLRLLSITECSTLISLFEEEDTDDVLRNMKFLTELCCLSVDKCPKLSSLVSGRLMYLTALKKLHISDCRELDWQMESQPQRPAAGLGDMVSNGLRSLESMFIDGLPKLVSLPNGLQTSATSLHTFYLKGCTGLTGLPEWLQRFKKLRYFVITDCPELSTLPSDGFLGLTGLQYLKIEGCPYLSLRFAENEWEHWPRNTLFVIDNKWVEIRETVSEGITVKTIEGWGPLFDKLIQTDQILSHCLLG